MVGVNITDSGAGISFGAPFTVSAGDQLIFTAPGVTNPADSGHDSLQISTSSDPVTALAAVHHRKQPAGLHDARPGSGNLSR